MKAPGGVYTIKICDFFKGSLFAMLRALTIAYVQDCQMVRLVSNGGRHARIHATAEQDHSFRFVRDHDVAARLNLDPLGSRVPNEFMELQAQAHRQTILQDPFCKFARR